MTHSDIADTLSRNLPDLYAESETSGNYKLLRPMAKYMKKTNDNIRDIDTASTVQNQMAADVTISEGAAEIIPENSVAIYNSLTVKGDLTVNGEIIAIDITVAGTGNLTVDKGTITIDNNFVLGRLAEMGKMLNTPPRENESIEKYRARLMVEFSLLTAETTIEDVLTITSEIFNIDVETINYTDSVGGENGAIGIDLPAQAVQQSDISEADISSLLDRAVPASYRVSILTVGTFTYITPDMYDGSNHDATKGYDGLDADGDPKDNGGTYAGAI